MRISGLILLVAFAWPLWAQTWTTEGPVTAPGPGQKGNVMVYRRDLGKWWQNADIVKKLQLTDSQISQLDQIFYDHRLRLIDYGADMEKRDLKLQTLLDADVPDEAQINAQVDQVLDARGKLEREATMMNLDLRKVLSLPQWRQLKTMRGPAGAFGDKILFRKLIPPPGGPDTAPLPPDPPPSPDGMF
jgi:Spy/CpxP family protein refolding chaperone